LRLAQSVISSHLPNHEIGLYQFDFTLHSVSGTLRYLASHAVSDHLKIGTLKGGF
jgi:hypothetical protein